MDDQTKVRLEKLAALIEATEHTHPLSQGYPLQWRGRPWYGFSVLGLVCLAHQNLTGNGRWIVSRVAPELPDYLVDGEKEQTFLPQPVVEYFGFRDNVGSFLVADLPQDVKRLMYRTAKSGSSSLYSVGRTYRKRGREIAVKVIRAMPPSLLKTGELSSKIPDQSLLLPLRSKPRQTLDLSDLLPLRSKPRQTLDLSDLLPLRSKPRQTLDLSDLLPLRSEPRRHPDSPEETSND